MKGVPTMNKIIGMKISKLMIGLLCVLMLITLAVSHNKRVLEAWEVTEVVIGLWQGQAEISGPLKKDPSPSDNAEDWLAIEIHIASDGSVSGKVGDAEFVDCTLKKNRTRLEEAINIKTDYIIEGQLVGHIVEADSINQRDISIPFNIVDHELKGSLFELEPWQYPYPLFPRLRLKEI